jgi:hypothetical protein
MEIMYYKVKEKQKSMETKFSIKQTMHCPLRDTVSIYSKDVLT